MFKCKWIDCGKCCSFELLHLLYTPLDFTSVLYSSARAHIIVQALMLASWLMPSLLTLVPGRCTKKPARWPVAPSRDRGPTTISRYSSPNARKESPLPPTHQVPTPTACARRLLSSAYWVASLSCWMLWRSVSRPLRYATCVYISTVGHTLLPASWSKR